MSIQFACPQCHGFVEAADGQAGAFAACRQCGHWVQVPTAQAPPPALAVAAPPTYSPPAIAPGNTPQHYEYAAPPAPQPPLPVEGPKYDPGAIQRKDRNLLIGSICLAVIVIAASIYVATTIGRDPDNATSDTATQREAGTEKTDATANNAASELEGVTRRQQAKVHR